MPSLLCFSPRILDHTFPRDESELRLVASSIGAVEERCFHGEAALLSLASLETYVIDFNWDSAASYPLLQDIYANLLRLLINPCETAIHIDVSDVEEFEEHPLPPNCSEGGVPELWRAEMGKLLRVHDACAEVNGYFIGIACDTAFSSPSPIAAVSYAEGIEDAFPIVGPKELASLIDAFAWQFDDSEVKGTISVADARSNIHLLGGRIVDQNASHIKVEFKGKRPWILDVNVDPQPDRFLKQLSDKSGLPYPVVRYILKFGRKPKLTCRLEKYCAA